MTLIRDIIHGDNLTILTTLPDKIAQMIYIDPPFNTGKTQKRKRQGDQSHALGNSDTSYEDRFDDFPAFLMPRIEASLHTLKDNGSLFVHLDYREVHYIKVALDKLLGRDKFINEIIWSYDYGGRSKTKWSAKHDTILWYVLNPKDYIFNFDEMERIPYMAPELVGEEKAARGKTPTDVFWHTICPTQGTERVGYPGQKPLGILNRLIKVHTNPGDTVLDYFCGSGTTGHSAIMNGRGYVLIDESEEAVEISRKRLSQFE
jgi:site-specific DNA-methyltransferase (adenine-specific)